MTQSKSQQDQAAEKTPPLEWAFAAIGAVLIMCTIGYMIYYGFTHPDSPPDLTVSHTATHVLPGGYLVQFTAKNEGNSTASGVLVSGTLVSDDGAVEESEVTRLHSGFRSEGTSHHSGVNAGPKTRIRLR